MRPYCKTKEIDKNYSHGNLSANSTTAKSQGSTMKDPKLEEFKVRGLKLSVPQCFNNNEFFEIAWKEKKKKQCQKD